MSTEHTFQTYGWLPYVVVEIRKGDRIEHEQARFEFRSDACEWARTLNEREKDRPRDGEYTYGVRTLRLEAS